MARKAESALGDRIRNWAKSNLPPGTIHWKLSDRATRGLPDRLLIGVGRITCELVVVALETKTPDGRLEPLQEHTLNKLADLQRFIKAFGGKIVSLVASDFEFARSEISKAFQLDG